MSSSTTHNTSSELLELRAFLEGLNLSEEDQLKAQEIVDRLDACLENHNLTLQVIKSGLSTLRFDAKYLLFDLEVTRRERDALQHKCEELQRRLRR